MKPSVRGDCATGIGRIEQAQRETRKQVTEVPMRHTKTQVSGDTQTATVRVRGKVR